MDAINEIQVGGKRKPDERRCWGLVRARRNDRNGDDGRCKTVSGPTIYALRSTSREGAARRLMRFSFAAPPFVPLYCWRACAARQCRKCITPTVRTSPYKAPRHRFITRATRNPSSHCITSLRPHRRRVETRR